MGLGLEAEAKTDWTFFWPKCADFFTHCSPAPPAVFTYFSNLTSCCSGQKRGWQLEEVWCPGTYSPCKRVDNAVKWRMWREREREREPEGSSLVDMHMVLSWLASPPLPPHHLWPLTTPSYGTFANKNGHGSCNQACSRPLTWKRGSTLQAHSLAPTGIVWPGECEALSYLISHCP